MDQDTLVPTETALQVQWAEMLRRRRTNKIKRKKSKPNQNQKWMGASNESNQIQCWILAWLSDFFLLFFSFYFFSSICQKRSTFHQNAHRQGHNELRLPHWHIQCTLRHNWLQRQVKKKDRRRRLNFHLFHSITWPYWNKSKNDCIYRNDGIFQEGKVIVVTKND